MRHLTDKRLGFYWEDPSDAENVFTAFLNEAGGLTVAVSNERAVGSFNETFECDAALTLEDAKRLRDYLTNAIADAEAGSRR